MKTAIVFGASGGVGRAVTKKLLDTGYAVCGAGLHAEKNEILKDELKADALSTYQIDVTDQASTRLCIEKISREHPKIDALVFSVSGSTKHKSILQSEWQDYASHLDVQLRGLFNIVASLKEAIIQVGGIRFVILLTEVCVGKPPSGIASYTAAKYALMGFAKCLSIELARYNCTVNMVSPGVLKTELTDHLPSKFLEIEAGNNPMGRIATPLDVAHTVMFLLSEEASYINGVNITVNGGGKIA